jgi:hypothetical protein
MLYIIDIDDYSFATSSVADEFQNVYPKLFYATSVLNYEDPENPLVTIRHKEDGSTLVSSKSILEITLDGTVYTDKEDFVSEFNALMYTGEGAVPGSLADVVEELEDLNVAVATIDSVLDGIATKQTDGLQKTQVVASGGANVDFATETKQTDGSQKSQVVTSGGVNVDFATAAKQTDGTQKSQTVDTAGINSESIIRTFGLTIIRPANTTVYAANDVIGDVGAAMLMFADVAKAAGYGIAVLGVRAQTNDTGLAGKALNVSFYNSALTTVIADNEPFVMADENAEKREGNVTLTFGSGILAKVSQNLDERIVLNPVARSVGCVVVTTGGFTPSANSTWIKLYIKCLLTN